jgi:hypothetical protein
VLRYRMTAVLAAMTVIVLPIALGACGSDDEAEAKPAVHSDFDAGKFSDSTNIDNEYSPLEPGTQYIFEGRSNRGLGRLPHQVIFTVTDLTKEIDGVTAVVMYDQDINDGKLLEGELATFAQDDDGNVWNMGEYPEEYEDGRVRAPDTWIAGLDGALGGIMMRSQPRVGTSSYRQGWAPDIEFADVARVHQAGLRDCVPLRCFTNVLVTDETNPTEPDDGHQRKFYAQGVGNIRAAPAGGKEKEVLVLTRVRRLGAAEMARARREAMKLDRRAYRVRADLYGRTPPVERAG